MMTTEVGMHYQTRGRHILLILPCLNITESGKATVLGQCDDGFGFHHFLGQILVCTLGNTCAAHFRCLGNGIKNGVDVLFVLRPRY